MGSTNPSGLVIISFDAKVSFLSTEWVDYVEEPMKYQALRPQFFSMGGWGWQGCGWWWDGVGSGGVRWGGWVFGGDGGDPFSKHVAM